MQLVAMVNDGHTTMNPLFDPAFGGHCYPVERHKFSDGLYVTSAAPDYVSIVGAKVLKFGSMNANDALAAAATTIGHENE